MIDELTPYDPPVLAVSTGDPCSFFDLTKVREALDADPEMAWTPEDHVKAYVAILRDGETKTTDKLRALTQFESFMAKIETDRVVRGMIRRTTTVDEEGLSKTVTTSMTTEMRAAIDMTPASEVLQKEKAREQHQDPDSPQAPSLTINDLDIPGDP